MVGRLAEIIQENAPSANVRLGVLPHALELIHVDVQLSALPGKFCELYNVGERIEQNGVGRSTIASGTSYLLIEALNALGQVIVYHPAHVAFVDAHAKGDSGANHLYLVVFELFLGHGTLLVGEGCMIVCCLEALSPEFRSHLLSILSA